jgi:hypothetical protein
MTTQCKLCGQLIHFNDKIVSDETGKKIPLNKGSDDHHRCKQWKELNRRYYKCNGCGVEIYFDDDVQVQKRQVYPAKQSQRRTARV